MKTVDVVPGILSDCFLQRLPDLSSDLNFEEVCVTKLDVLKYVQYLRISTKLDSNEIYNTVANHVEKFRISGSGNWVKRYVLMSFSTIHQI